MADLFGKPEKATVTYVPFYCSGCGGTRSTVCKKHGTRHCAAGKNRCSVGFCDPCDLGIPPKAEQEVPGHG